MGINEIDIIEDNETDEINVVENNSQDEININEEEIDEINVVDSKQTDEINVEDSNSESEINVNGEQIVYKGVEDYNELKHQPSINNVVLVGNKTSEELDLQQKGEYADTRVTNIEIDNLF